MAKLKDILAMIDATKDTATVKYITDEYVQYAFNGMPGAMMMIAKNSVLNLEATNIECVNNRLVITVKAPVVSTETTASTSSAKASTKTDADASTGEKANV